MPKSRVGKPRKTGSSGRRSSVKPHRRQPTDEAGRAKRRRLGLGLVIGNNSFTHPFASGCFCAGGPSR